MFTLRGPHGHVFVDENSGKILHVSPCLRRRVTPRNIEAHVANWYHVQNARDEAIGGFEPLRLASPCEVCGGFGYVRLLSIDIWALVDACYGKTCSSISLPGTCPTELTNARIETRHDLRGLTISIAQRGVCGFALSTKDDPRAMRERATNQATTETYVYRKRMWASSYRPGSDPNFGVTVRVHTQGRNYPTWVKDLTTQTIYNRTEFIYEPATAEMIHTHWPDSELDVAYRQHLPMGDGLRNNYVSSGLNYRQFCNHLVTNRQVDFPTPYPFSGIELLLKVYDDVFLPACIRIKNTRRRPPRKKKWERKPISDPFGGLA